MNNIRNISDEEILDYCTRQEDDFFDRKSSRVKGAKLQEIAVAFANSEGGVIIVGIEDEKVGGPALDRWMGKEKIEGFNEEIQALAELNPGIDFKHSFLSTAGKYVKTFVLRIEVLKSLKVHETKKGEVYLRRGAQSLKISGIKIQELMRAKGISSAEDTQLSEIEPEIIVDSEHLKNYLFQLPVTDKDPLSFLIQERFIHPDTFSPTVAGALLFASNPSALLGTQCAVKVVRYDSTEDDIDRDNLTDDIHTIEGPLYELIKNSMDKINDVLSRCIIWTMNDQRAAAYPHEALWELLINSVLHRDYAVSDNVLISIYRNRIEFRSPGRLPGYVTPENILDNRFSRNPKLVRLLSRYPNSPNKDLGEGVNTVFERMRKAGFIEPSISDKNNCVTVTLRRTPLRNQHEVLRDFIASHGSISNHQALDLLGLENAEQITTIFAKMKEKGDIQKLDERQTGIRVRWTLSIARQGEIKAMN